MISDDDFGKWSALKLDIHKKDNRPHFKQREIWWCSLGVNLGYEIYGKGVAYTRPVLVIRKFNSATFLAIPLSTKIKDSPNYFKFEFKDKIISAAFDQTRAVDCKRLIGKMGRLPENEFQKIKEAFKLLI